MKKNILKILTLIIITLNLGVATTFAANPATPADPAKPSFTQTKIPKPDTLPGPTGADKRKALTTGILPKLAVFMVGSTASFSLLFLIISGVRFVTAYGNDEGIQHAKKQAIYAIVGLLVSLFAYTIVRIVSNFNYAEDAPAVNEIPGAESIEGVDTPSTIKPGNEIPNNIPSSEAA